MGSDKTLTTSNITHETELTVTSNLLMGSDKTLTTSNITHETELTVTSNLLMGSDKTLTTSNITHETELTVTSNLLMGSDKTLTTSNITHETELTLTSNLLMGSDKTLTTSNIVAHTGDNLTVSSNFEVGTSNLFVNTANGNVGIGINPPTEKLHVAGNILATGTLSATELIGSGAAITNVNAARLGGQYAYEMSWGHQYTHATFNDFNSFLNTAYFGAHFLHQSTNGPGHSGATQYYHQRMSLGSEYNQYSLQLAIPRARTDAYLYYRNEENSSPSAWYKMRAGYSDSAGKLETTRAINGVNFDGTAAITVNGLNYNVNNVWLRESGDNAHFKIYGNSRQMVFRTDGFAEYAANIGNYPFVWMYDGDGNGNRRMILNTSGQLWCSNYGYLHDKFADKAGSTAQDFYTRNLYVGPNDNSATAKTLSFGSTVGDPGYENAVIERRRYGGSELSELLMFSGNDNANGSGPDRIRLRAGEISFDVYPSATTSRTTENIRAKVTPSGIDVIGYIKSQNPIFSASGPANWVTYNAQVPVVLTTTMANIGSCYSTSTGAFTVPVGGYYQFNATLYTNGSGQYVFLWRGSSSNAWQSWSAANDAIWTSLRDGATSKSLLIALNANAQIAIGWRNGSSGGIYRGHSWFSGFLISTF